MKDYHVRLRPDAITALDRFAEKRNLPRAAAASVLIEEAIFGRDYVPPKSLLPPPNFVYVIQLGDLYKIGRSVNPGKRVKGMQLPAKPSEESFQWRCADAKKLEKELHEMFKHKRAHGEWFRLDLDDLDNLNNYCYQQSISDLT